LFEYSVPILGWSSSVQVSDGYDGRVIAASAAGTSTVSTPAGAVIVPTTITRDETGSLSAAGVYTIPSSGWYQADGFIRAVSTSVSANDILALDVLKNGSQVVALGATYANATANLALATSGSTKYYFKAGETLSFRAASSVNMTLDAFYCSISKLSGHPTISASETVAARYYSTTAQSVGTASVINFDLKDFDTHGAVTTGASWSFKVPTYGIYEINSSFLTATTTSVQNFFYIIYKDGVSSDKAVAWHIKETTNSSRQFGKGSSLIELKAGESINLRGSASGSSTNLSGDQSMNFIEIKLVK